MKRIAIIVFVLVASSAHAQEKAKVYIIRHTGMGTKTASLFDGDKEIAAIKDKKYTIVDLEPGQHIFTIQKSDDKRTTLDLESGKTYYLLMIVQVYNTGWKWEFVCTELTERYGKQLLAEGGFEKVDALP